MQLDQTHIAIRERTWLENLDLALHVTRAGGRWLLASALAGVLPVLAINSLLIATLGPGNYYDDLTMRGRLWVIMLVMIQAPLATAPLTLYLGQALFDDRPGARRIGRDFLSSLPQLILLQLVVRTFLIASFVLWILPYGVWPFLNEVILLERTPLVARRGQLSTFKRCQVLHEGNGGDFLARGLAMLVLATLLLSALWVTQDFLLSTLVGYEPGYLGHALIFQAIVWILTVFLTVARFLCYLDQRIRREGWEVELFLRAQRNLLARQPA